MPIDVIEKTGFQQIRKNYSASLFKLSITYRDHPGVRGVQLRLVFTMKTFVLLQLNFAGSLLPFIKQTATYVKEKTFASIHFQCGGGDAS